MTDVFALVGKEGALTDEECMQLFRDVARPGALYVAGAENPLPKLLPVRLAIDQIRAIKGFNAASEKLTERLIWFTWALVFVGAVQLAVDIHSGLEKFIGPFSTAPSALGFSRAVSLPGARLR